MLFRNKFLQVIDPAEYPHEDDHQSGSRKYGGNHKIGTEDGTVPAGLKGHTEDPGQYRVNDDGYGYDNRDARSLYCWPSTTGN